MGTLIKASLPPTISDAGLQSARRVVDTDAGLDDIGAARVGSAPTSGSLGEMAGRDTGVVAQADLDRIFRMYSPETIEAQRQAADQSDQTKSNGVFIRRAAPSYDASTDDGAFHLGLAPRAAGSAVSSDHPLYQYARPGETLSALETRLFGRQIS